MSIIHAHGSIDPAPASMRAIGTAPQPRWYRVAGVFLVLAVLLFASRWPMGREILKGEYRNGDEPLLHTGVVSGMLGGPGDALCWPAGPLRLLCWPVFVGDWLLHPVFGRSLDGFVAYLSAQAHSWHQVWLMRLIVMAVSSLGIASLVFPFARSTRNLWIASAGVILVGVLPQVWLRSYLALGDAVGVGFLCLAIAVGWRSKTTPARVAWAGLFLGLALSSKIVLLMALPFVLAVAVSGSPRAWRALVLGCAFVAVGFLLGSPWALSEPIRFVKSVLGNVVRSGLVASDTSLAVRLARNITNGVPEWALLLLLGGLGAALWERRWWLVVGVLGSLGIMIVATVRAPTVAPNYFIPIAVMCVVMAVLVLAPRVMEIWRRQSGRLRSVTALAALLVWAALVTISAMDLLRLDRQGYDRYVGYFRAYQIIRNTPGIRTAILEITNHGTDLISSASLNRAADQIEQNMIHGGTAVSWVRTSLHVQEYTARILARTFDEREVSMVALLRLAAGSQDHPGMDVRFWHTDAARMGWMSREQAAQAAVDHSVDLVLLDDQPGNNPPGGLVLGTDGGLKCILYFRPGLHAVTDLADAKSYSSVR